MPEEHDPEQLDSPDPVDFQDKSHQPDTVPSGDPDHDVWTGRAGVRPYNAVPRDPYEGESDWADPNAVEPSGRWWAPIALGTVGVGLLALLGLGIVVIVQNAGGDTNPPETTPTAVRVTTGKAADPEVTTPPAAPPPEPTPATTEPVDAEVNVPALRGMPLADAQAALSRSGLQWRVIRRESDAEPDTVIDCDPAEGQQVPSDTRVTLVVATAPANPPTVPPTAPSAGASR